MVGGSRRDHMPRRACSAATRSRSTSWGVDRAMVGVLRVTATCVGVEQPNLAFLNLADPLVDGVLRQQTMDLNSASLTHAVGAGDGLLLDPGLPVGFGEDDRRRGLDVQPDPACLDLGDEHGVAVGRPARLEPSAPVRWCTASAIRSFRPR